MQARLLTDEGFRDAESTALASADTAVCVVAYPRVAHAIESAEVDRQRLKVMEQQQHTQRFFKFFKSYLLYNLSFLL